MYVIYCIECKETKRQYIGKTSNFTERIKQHKKYAKMEVSDRSHMSLYIDMKIRGIDNFIFYIIIDNIEKPYDASYKEKELIESLNPYYNNIGGGGGSKSTDDELIVQMYNKYKNIKKICLCLKQDRQTIKKALERNGIFIDRYSGSKEQKIEIESFDLNTHETIKKYESFSSASIDISGSTNGRSAIRKCIDGKVSSYHKMGWRLTK